MKKIPVFFLLLLACGTLSAKKVKFAVDLTGSTPSPNGIHVTGDFQSEAGFPGGDWLPGTTLLTNEPGTEIYSIVVDIPAFTKYEYVFVNGDQSYEYEFIPIESRANYNFSDYRWLYVDSIANDTTFAGAILFAGNAPTGLSLVRFRVNMTGQSIDPAGVHVAGTFQGWNPATIRMFSFNDSVYEYIAYVVNGSYEFRYVNGNTAAGYENVYGSCASNYGRSVSVTGDIVLDPANFSSCLVGVSEELQSNDLRIFPNPASGFFTVSLDAGHYKRYSLSLSDVTGRVIRTLSLEGMHELKVETVGLPKGLYSVSINAEDKESFHSMIVVE